jgi:hypothetical protein
LQIPVCTGITISNNFQKPQSGSNPSPNSSPSEVATTPPAEEEVVIDTTRYIRVADVLILNTRNGQLEAAATDAHGRFETGFHVLDCQPEDQFEIRIGSLGAPVAHRFRTGLTHLK